MENFDPHEELQKRKNTESFQKILVEFSKTSKTILEKCNGISTSSPDSIVFYNLFQRVYISLCAINILINEFKRNKYFKYPLALQIRGSILDSITIVYLAGFKHSNNQSGFEHQLARLNYFPAKEILKTFTDGVIDAAQIQKQITFFNLENNFIQTPIGFEINKSVTNITVKQMSEEIEKSAPQLYHTLYQYYKYYSQYEHYGTVSKRFLDFHAEYDFDKMVVSIFDVLSATCVALEYIPVDISNKNRLYAILEGFTQLDRTFRPN